MKAIINKWIHLDTTVTLPRTRCPTKIKERTNKVIRKTGKRPMATSNAKCVAYVACTGQSVQVPTISYSSCLGYGKGG